MSDPTAAPGSALPGAMILGVGGGTIVGPTAGGLYVVSFPSVVPPARYDAASWTSVQIFQASTLQGPWTLLDTQAITIDQDPANPQPHAVTLEVADPATYFMLVFVDVNGDLSAPVVQAMGQPTESRPTIREVATLLRARTKVMGGKEEGTFTVDTRPTAVEVEALIEDAISEVSGKVQPIDPTLPAGSPLGPGSAYERRWRGAVALYTAILIELSYFPEQTRTGQSPVATLQQLYESRIRALIAEGETGRPEGEGTGGPGGGDSPADAFWSFPAAAPGALVGWQTRW